MSSYEISKSHFRQLRSIFVEYLDDIPNFLDHAMKLKLLVRAHKTQVMAIPNTDNQIRALLDIIDRKLPECSSVFVEALKKSENTNLLQYFGRSKSYSMTNNPHGRCVIISNINYKGLTFGKREGGEKDKKDVEALFIKLKFDVKSYEDKTAKDIEGILKDHAEEEEENEDCFILFLMSHGKHDGIYGCDGKLVTFDFINQTLLNSKKLENKPKLIYINACQPITSEDTTDSKGRPNNFTGPDMFALYSTVPGDLSYRHPEEGSRFVQALVKEYESNDNVDVVANVPSIINCVYEYRDEIRQIAFMTSTLRMECIIRS